jgi:hypothetical protein
VKFLCLAYGDSKDWHALSEERRQELLAQDDVLRERGDLVSPVGEVTVVRAWDGTPSTTNEPFATGPAPMAGFSIVEAEDLDEAVRLVAGTPCAVAKGAIEIRPLIDIET